MVSSFALMFRPWWRRGSNVNGEIRERKLETHRHLLSTVIPSFQWVLPVATKKQPQVLANSSQSHFTPATFPSHVWYFIYPTHIHIYARGYQEKGLVLSLITQSAHDLGAVLSGNADLLFLRNAHAVKQPSIGCYLGTRSFGSISMTDYD